MVRIDDVQKLGKDNMDATLKSFGAFSKSLQAITVEIADYSKKVFEQAGLGEVKFTTNAGTTRTFDPTSPYEEQRRQALSYLKSRVDITHVLGGDSIMSGPFIYPYGVFPVTDTEAAERQTPGVGGLGHIAFRVESEAALKDAYAALQAHGVEIARTIDHVSQKSIYFNDPDGNTLEIYFELPDALEIFARGRNDRDVELNLKR